MSALAVGMMIGVATLVWGGFLLLLARAVWREGRKNRPRQGGG